MDRDKITKSLFWKLCERSSNQIIAFAIQIILARLVLPEDFGAIAIIGVFTNIANIFIQKGFSYSIIRLKNASEEDYNTALIVSEGIALLFVFLLFAISPIIAKFYGNPDLRVYLRAISLTLVFGSFFSIENAILIREMKFKLIFFRAIIATGLSGGIGIILAYFGAGIWALIIQGISLQILLCIVTFFGCNWKPRLYFSKKSFDCLFSFGAKLLASEIIFICTEDLRTLIIGKRYTAKDLAYYNRGQFYPNVGMLAFYNTITSVLLPVLSQEQDNIKKMQRMIELSLVLSFYVIFPIFVGFSAISYLFVIIFLTERWEASIPFLKLFCIYQLAFPVYGILRQSLYAIGDSNGVLKLEIFKGVLFLVAIFIGCLISPYAIALSSGIAFYSIAIAYALYAHKQIKFNMHRVLKSLLLTLFQCAIMYLIILLFNHLSLSRLVLFLADIPLGVGVYFATSILFKNKEFLLLKDFIKQYRITKDFNIFGKA